jgi:hypothetical protein|tara:strand:+ start:152 stop:697 length:546 start_codon:yes stop_codon:yes gene_type:complete
MMSVWKTLSAINVNEHTEKKGNLTYLSWAWAWSALMEHYPDSSYTYGPPSFLENGTCEVNVSVTVKDKTHPMWLPVMDNRNKAVPNPTSRDISDARMRCLVKAIAMHGLGAYIYAGEDLPAPTTITPEQIKKIEDLIAKTDTDKAAFCSWLSVSNVSELFASQFDTAMTALNHKWEKMNES